MRPGIKSLKERVELLRLRLAQQFQSGHPARRAPRQVVVDVRAHLRAFPELGFFAEVLPAQERELEKPRGLPVRWFRAPEKKHHAFPSEGLYYLKNARVAPGYVGAVVTADNVLLRPFSRDPFGWGWHRSSNRFSLPPVKRLAGRTLFLGTAEAHANYYHFLLDFMPRLLMARHAWGGWDGVDHILLEQGTLPFFSELLAAAGVPVSRVIPMDASSHFVCDELVVPDDTASEFYVNPGRIGLLRTLPSRGAGRGERIFLSRRTARVRRLLNEAALAEGLAKLGYAEVTMDGLSVAEQHAILASARSIVAVHGAAMANLVFCAPGAQVIEIADEKVPRGYYWSVSQAVGLRHQFFPATSDAHLHDNEIHRINSRDLRVDVPALLALVSRLEG